MFNFLSVTARAYFQSKYFFYLIYSINIFIKVLPQSLETRKINSPNNLTNPPKIIYWGSTFGLYSVFCRIIPSSEICVHHVLELNWKKVFLYNCRHVCIILYKIWIYFSSLIQLLKYKGIAYILCWLNQGSLKIEDFPNIAYKKSHRKYKWEEMSPPYLLSKNIQVVL